MTEGIEKILDSMDIASRAMKVTFHKGVGATRRSRDAAAEQLVRSNLGDEGQIVTRRLFTDPQGIIAKRQELANQMYSYHISRTLPHGDDGSRLLPNELYFDYVQDMGSFEQRISAADVQIIGSYQQLVAEDVVRRNAALARQGKPQTAAPADYPDAQRMAAYLYVNWVIEPIPTANDFRYAVAQSVKDKLAARQQEMVAAANVDLLNRMMEPMKRFVEKLAVPIGDEGSVFRNTLVENINDLTEELPKFNFTDDPKITAAIAELKSVITPYAFNPNLLREQPEIRESAKEKMDALLKKFDDYKLGV